MYIYMYICTYIYIYINICIYIYTHGIYIYSRLAYWASTERQRRTAHMLSELRFWAGKQMKYIDIDRYRYRYR